MRALLPTHHEADGDPADCDCEAHGRSGLSRRGFMGLVGTGAAVVGYSSLGSRLAFATPENPSTGDVLVVVFMRGGWDGLDVVAPYQMPTYKALRPTIRIKEPSEFTDPTGKAGLPLVDGGNLAPFPQ